MRKMFSRFRFLYYFKTVLKDVEESISNATFLTIDGEFTGLNEKWNLNAYDTPEERYQKLREGCMKFLVIQFGLCTFHHDSANEKFTHRAFNFYIFPQDFGRNYPDPRFLCQSSSMEFLSSQGFDFNKMIKGGISFLRQDQEDRLRRSMKEKHDALQQVVTPKGSERINGADATPKTPLVVPVEHQEFVNNILRGVEAFLASEDKTLELAEPNGYKRKLIYDSVRPKFPSLRMETVTNEKKERSISIRKVVEGEEINNLREIIEADEAKLEDAVGFTKVLRIISKSKKLVVGHNMMLDVMHLVEQFFTNLPESYEDFKTLTRSIFPRILDTKLMSSIKPLKEMFSSTALNDLFKATKEGPLKPVAVEVAEGKEGYSTDREQLHEAGYDAYITGLCFLSMANYLGSLQNSKAKNVLPDSPLVEAYTNKMHMMLSPDIPYMNLTGTDPIPNRDHVFHVTVPKEWKREEVNQLFSPYGTIHICWLQDNSAFVALRWPEQATSAKSLLHNKHNACTVMLYSDYVQSKRRSLSGPALKDRTGPVPLSDVSADKRKRSNSSSSDVSSTSRICDPIPEEEDDAANREPTPKKQRSNDDPTRKKLFDEPDSWT